MSNILCTFSGGFGDILWSLATVKEISKKHGTKVDMMIMPQYQSLSKLLSQQSYIRKAIINFDWICTGSPHGDQPWEAPLHSYDLYDQVYHLTYRRHPGPTEPLIDFIAAPHLIKLENPIPFIELPKNRVTMKVEGIGVPYIAWCFNDMYVAEKKTFFDKLESDLYPDDFPKVMLIDTRELSWLDAAICIKNALAFIGCRSSNYVLAHGVGQKNILVYEPHPNRNANGYFGNTFGNPHWPEHTLPLDPKLAAETVSGIITNILEETKYLVK